MNGEFKRFNSFSVSGKQNDPVFLFKEVFCPEGYKLSLAQVTGKPRKIWFNIHFSKE